MRARTLRARLTAVAVLIALLAIAALTMAFNLVLGNSLDSDARGKLRSRADAARTTISIKGGHVRVSESPGDAAVDELVWIYQGKRSVERPLSSSAIQRAADRLAGSPGGFSDVAGHDFRFYASPVRAGGAQVGTVIAGASVAAYERTTNLALLGSVLFGLVLLAAMAVLTWLVVGRALGPVTGMTRTAADWSAHEPDRRFGSDRRPDELGELARTFDDLLDRVAASLRHEQRLSAELSHELRTPLARIVGQVELLQRRDRSPGERREALDAIGRSADQMSSILETLMATARADAGLDRGRVQLAEVLRRMAEEWRPQLAQRGVELVVEPPGDLVAGVDAEVVERIIAPMLDNATRMARRRVVVSAARAPDGVSIFVSDDGPGVAASAQPQLFEPGRRAGANSHGGAGLGLPLARRLARALGGDVTFEPAQLAGGATFRADLPA
jgi:signal transduction histidine kinase